MLTSPRCAPVLGVMPIPMPYHAMPCQLDLPLSESPSSQKAHPGCMCGPDAMSACRGPTRYV